MLESATHDSTGACWVDGLLQSPGTASGISPLDHAIVVGDGVFETMKVVDGTAFALTRHLRRLRFSAEGMGMLPADDDRVRDAVAAVLDADPAAGKLRITWSSGVGPLGSSRGDGPGTLIVATEPGSTWPADEAVHLCRWTRNEHGALVGLKTTSYAENVIALEAAHAHGCSEALFANTAGDLCEGTGTNVFLVVEGELVTPPLSSGCLAGVTRELLLEEMAVTERQVDPDEFARASEAFLTSTTRDVSAIARVDDLVLPEAPGPVTVAAQAVFADLCTRSLDP
jgi:branched-chain amino acid aminotransferase